jgi:hypothetical protein
MALMFGAGTKRKATPPVLAPLSVPFNPNSWMGI